MRLVLPGDIAKFAVDEAVKAVTKMNAPAEGESSGKMTRSEKAGLTFPVGRVHRLMKERQFANRIANGASVYLTAVLQFLASEVLELAGMTARDNKSQRILPRHLLL